MTEFLYHIATRDDWREARDWGHYRSDSLEDEGFIHLSSRDQVLETAGRYYAGRNDLVLLFIDPDLVGESEVVWENTVGGTENFPHLYGPLPLGAVVEARDFPPGEDGSFSFPR